MRPAVMVINCHFQSLTSVLGRVFLAWCFRVCGAQILNFKTGFLQEVRFGKLSIHPSPSPHFQGTSNNCCLCRAKLSAASNAYLNSMFICVRLHGVYGFHHIKKPSEKTIPPKRPFVSFYNSISGSPFFSPVDMWQQLLVTSTSTLLLCGVCSRTTSRFCCRSSK